MNEVLAGRYQFIPDCLVRFFINDTLDAYFDAVEEVHVPNVWSLTYDVIDPVGLQAAGYHATTGEDIDFFNTQVSALNGEEQADMYYGLLSKNFEPTFNDVARLLKAYHLTHCFLDDPDEGDANLYHYGVEVW
jgi:hypothetical protein